MTESTRWAAVSFWRMAMQDPQKPRRLQEKATSEASLGLLAETGEFEVGYILTSIRIMEKFGMTFVAQVLKYATASQISPKLF